MKHLILCCFLILNISYAETTSTKIKDSKRNLSNVKHEKERANLQLEKIAKNIKKANSDINYLDNKINELSQDIDDTEAKYKDLKNDLISSTKDFKATSKELDKKREQFISLLSDQFSILFAMKKSHEPTKKSIIMQEVYNEYRKQNIEMIEDLKKDIEKLKKSKRDKYYLHNNTKNKIQKIIKRREKFAQKKLAKKKLFKKLSLDEEKYSAKLDKIANRQNAINDKLAQLNILHDEEVEKLKKQAKERKETIRLEKERKRAIRKEKELARKKALAAEKALRTAKTEKAKEKAQLATIEAEKQVANVKKREYKQSERVRSVNSSYKKSKTYAYRGGKTISPIAGAKVIKKFGTYIDPIYKIKIFNESITLKAPTSNAKVKTVLNGKVVFAGKSSMLGKVVVVAHGGRMHTVYAGLSKIAPNIKTGRKIRKGYVVGKVKSKLMFQATKNSKHINPLKLIRI